MSNEFPGGDDSASTSFEAWLDQQAESQGMTREELFEQLVSSYWTLNEMTQLIDDSGGPGVPMPPPRNRSESESDPTADPDGAGRQPPDRQEGSTGDERSGDGRRTEEGDPAPEDPMQSGDDDDRTDDRIDDLEARLDALESDVETEVEHGQTLDQLFDALANRLTEVERDLDEVAATAESTEASLSERIEALESDLTERQDALEDEQEQVEKWLDTEFDSLRTILEYLLDRTDGLEREVETADARQERELERLRAEREALQSIKGDAASHDAHEGECQACGEAIDLDLLTRPHCPHCDALLTGVEIERRLWLFTDTVVTTRGTADDESRSTGAAERSSPLPSRERESEQRTDATASSGRTERPREPDRTTAEQGPTGGGSPANSEGPDAGSDPNRARDRDGRQSAGRNDRGDGDAERPPESLDLESSFGGLGDSARTSERGKREDRGTSTASSEAADPTADEHADRSSGFQFDATAGSDDDDDAPSNESERDAEPTQRGSPFGDLEDLRREESGESGT